MSNNGTAVDLILGHKIAARGGLRNIKAMQFANSCTLRIIYPMHILRVATLLKGFPWDISLALGMQGKRGDRTGTDG